MITVYQIRGTNGSGKSTLVRAYAGAPLVPAERIFDNNIQHGPLDLVWYPAPTKVDPGRRKSVEGYGIVTPELSTIVVGSYRTACGGLDGIESFDRSFRAIRKACNILGMLSQSTQQRAVLCEGVISSTVWGSWGQFARECREDEMAQFAFCYLDTPVEVCLERIRKRQEAAGKVRPINEQLVHDKVKAVTATREKAIAAGEIVYDLPHWDVEHEWNAPAKALESIMMNHNVRCFVGTEPAREYYRAFR